MKYYLSLILFALIACNQINSLGEIEETLTFDELDNIPFEDIKCFLSRLLSDGTILNIYNSILEYYETKKIKPVIYALLEAFPPVYKAIDECFIQDSNGIKGKIKRKVKKLVHKMEKIVKKYGNNIVELAKKALNDPNIKAIIKKALKEVGKIAAIAACTYVTGNEAVCSAAVEIIEEEIIKQ